MLADTGGLIVLIDKGHELHAAAVTLISQEQLLVPSSVLPEFDYLVSKHFGAAYARQFIDDMIAGYYDYLSVELEDVTRASELMKTYSEAQIGFVDASVVALAERHQIRRVLTTDRRHFSMFRPKGLEYLELLP